jgi:phthalate 4,5-dioxygenase
MLSREDNDILTQTDRGTPMGEVFRRYWIPVLLSEEVPLPDCPPVRFRVLGEDLLAIRDSDGRVGVMDPHCPHRGAPLFFGRNEESGIRCLYHGWKFDVDGACTDMPNVPNGDIMKNRMRIIAYPTVEQAGMVWAYMGPEERKPPLPAFPFFGLPDAHTYVTKYELQCNWFQAHEGDFDATHAQFVHSGKPDAPVTVKAQGEHMRRTLKSFDTPIGYVFASAHWQDDGMMKLDVRQNVYPSTCPPGSGSGNGVLAANIRLPIDDSHEWHFRLRYAAARPLTPKELLEFKMNGYAYDAHEPGGWRAKGNKDNDYLQDRILQRQFSYSGLTAFQRQDAAMLEDQWGAICDRTKEHLVAPDLCLVQTRNRLLTMAKNLAAGKELEEPFLLAEREIVQQIFGDPLEPVPASNELDEATSDLIASRLNTVRVPDYSQAFDSNSLRALAHKTWDEVVSDV